MSYADELLKRYPIANVRTLVLITNCIYILAMLLKMYKSNSAYFFENAFQVANLFFYLFVLLSYFFIKNTRFYFLSSLLLILDLPVNLKPQMQNLLVHAFHIAGVLNHQLAIDLVILLILACFIFLLYKFDILAYCQVFLFFFYSASLVMMLFQSHRPDDTPLHIGYRVSTISKNYYFLLFDEYPAEQVIRKYGLADKADYPSVFLNKEGFKVDTGFYSNYISTVRSTTNFLTGSFQAKYGVNNTIETLRNNVYTNGLNYSFDSFSIFDDQNRPNSLFSRYYFYNFNNFLTSKIIPYLASFFTKRGVGNYTDCDNYNADAINKLNELSRAKHPHLAYIHFFAPHYYPLVNGQPISERIKNANQWILKAIQTLHKNDPGAGVVIFSDHGLRTQNIPVKLRNKNILYFRDVTVDTTLLNKNGLVDLAKSIKY